MVTVGHAGEADRLKDETAKGMHTELLRSLTISHDLLKHLDGIAETYYIYDFKGHQLFNFLMQHYNWRCPEALNWWRPELWFAA